MGTAQEIYMQNGFVNGTGHSKLGVRLALKMHYSWALI